MSSQFNDIVRTILIMSLSGGVLALILFALKPLIRHHLPKSAQYYLWLVALAALLIPVSKLILLPQTPSNVPVASIQAMVEQNVVTAQEAAGRLSGAGTNAAANTHSNDSLQTKPAPAPAELPVRSVLSTAITVFMAVYFWIVLAVLLYHILSYAAFTGKVRRHRSRVWMDELCEHVGFCGAAAIPRLYRSALVQTPMLIGIFKSEIVLPDRAYSDAQLQNMLRHELTHLRRRDVVVKWLSALACALHWFNPVVWLMRREINRACELSCDEAVIRSLDRDGKQVYGETLISVAADTRVPRTVLSTTMCAEKKNLKERLNAIMTHKKCGRAALLVSALIFIMAVCAACALGAGAGAPPSADPTATVEPTVTATLTPEPSPTTDLSYIKDYFTMTEGELLSKLGSNYTITGAGAEGLQTGYQYNDTGLVFVFDADDNNTLDTIYCPEGFEVNGARAGMSLDEIQKYLGPAEIQHGFMETPDHPFDFIDYVFDGLVYRFGGYPLIIFRSSDSVTPTPTPSPTVEFDYSGDLPDFSAFDDATLVCYAAHADGAYAEGAFPELAKRFDDHPLGLLTTISDQDGSIDKMTFCRSLAGEYILEGRENDLRAALDKLFAEQPQSGTYDHRPYIIADELRTQLAGAGETPSLEELQTYLANLSAYNGTFPDETVSGLLQAVSQLVDSANQDHYDDAAYYGQLRATSVISTRSSEGMIGYGTNYTAIHAALSGKLSDAYESYLKLREKYDSAYWVSDGALGMSWDDLAQMLIDWSGFQKSYPDFVDRASVNDTLESALRLYTGYLNLDNTRVIQMNYSRTAATLAQDVKASYEKFLGDPQNKVCVSYNVIDTLYQTWKASQFQYTQAVKDFYTALGAEHGWTPFTPGLEPGA